MKNKMLIGMFFSLGTLLLVACAENIESTKGYENFKGFNERAVGRALTYRLVTNGRKPLAVLKLPNGNDQYRYELNGPNVRRPSCIVIYEVNPKTEIVVRSSFEGDEKGCVIVP
jgi:hypothetical protein